MNEVTAELLTETLRDILKELRRMNDNYEIKNGMYVGNELREKI